MRDIVKIEVADMIAVVMSHLLPHRSLPHNHGARLMVATPNPRPVGFTCDDLRVGTGEI